jgi:hypothetical protein
MAGGRTTAGVGAAPAPRGADEGRAPWWAGFPGHGGLRTGAGKQGRPSYLDCSTSVLWGQARRQPVNHGSEEAVLNRVAQFGVDLAGRVQARGVQTVESHHPRPNGALPFYQAPPPGAHLKLRGHDDARGQGQAPGRFTDQVQDKGGFAGRGYEELDVTLSSPCG